jgi:uncharacterized protein (TIGR02246 family)
MGSGILPTHHATQEKMMKRLTKPLVMAATLAALPLGNVAANSPGDDTPIRSVLSTYEQALNASDVGAVLKLYESDGVFMAQHSLPSVGTQAIRTAYEGVFGQIQLDIDFIVDEVRILDPQWAFARTRSKGFVTLKASQQKNPEANQELFIFHKQGDGQWKIAQYIFSTTNPPRQ